MKKLRLTLDDLSVDSFPTSRRVPRSGTVAGHDHSDTTCDQVICTCPTHGWEPTCQGCGSETCGDSCAGSCDTCVGCGSETCDASCVGTCGVTCANTCDCTLPPDLVC